MKLHFPLLAVLVFLLGSTGSGPAAALSDADADLVPDAFDNCLVVANGPNQGSNQVDTDLDGYGEACDPDYDNNGAVTATDFAEFLRRIGQPGPIADHDGNGFVTAVDFVIFLQYFGGVPGPSGLACAGTVPCIP